MDLYSASGQLLTRLEHGDWLNTPWGITLAPLDFGRFSHDLLVGQFGGGGSTPSAGLSQPMTLLLASLKDWSRIRLASQL